MDKEKFLDLTNNLDGGVLLITGGTGSFGNALVDRLLNTKIKEIRIFSRDEKKQDDMRRRYGSKRLNFFLGDIRDYKSVLDSCTGVDFVFHAAALKQVPSCEFFPLESVKTNVIGSSNVIEASIACGVQRLVGLSTDKAVYPVNAMGISKAMMEKVFLARARHTSTTTINLTRYGNVIGSRGSVVPRFIDQVRTGVPITITNPEMTRFLMTLDQAVELVLFTFKSGRPGELYVQKSPSATISAISDAVKLLLDVPNHPVRIIGTRHGEKLYETLVSREELSRATETAGYFRIQPDDRDLDYERYFDIGNIKIDSINDYNSNSASLLEAHEVAEMIHKSEIDISMDTELIENQHRK